MPICEPAPLPATDLAFVCKYQNSSAESPSVVLSPARLHLYHAVFSFCCHLTGFSKEKKENRPKDGSRGHLEGLASVYCEMLMAPFGEVLAALEEARLRAWSERSPHSSSGGSGVHRAGHRGNSCHGGLPNSHSQPIYVPGKYSPSSCLSDKEEDEIYGFGYGVFAPRVARTTLQQHQQLSQSQQSQSQQQSQNSTSSSTSTNTTNTTNVPANSAGAQQSCLSPRSAYFYEFPPTDGRETSKKRTTLARLLRGLKTVNRRDRSNQNNGGSGANAGGGVGGGPGTATQARGKLVAR
ncbi:hypothetical protein pipiens_002229 [Culex pipiens pipiens]|uniref:Uncharacterized protein n=1 Tax=Culex pipiens pipiens TaxID=38569 RepID=A0ABD1DI68_CULPP